MLLQNYQSLYDDKEQLINLRIMVEDLLLTLAFRNSICGTAYLRDAIVNVAIEENKYNCYNNLYQEIAVAHNTTASRVNKAIRHALDVCFNTGKLKRINQIFHKPIVDNYLPTNSELISTLALLMRRQIAVDKDGKVVVRVVRFENFY